MQVAPGAPPGVSLWVMKAGHPADPARCLASLSEEEKARARKIPSPRLRLRYASARRGLRTTLATAAGVDPADVVVRTGPGGKPWAEAGGRKVRFSFSDADGAFALAVSSRREVGVDIERVSHSADIEGIAGRFFSAGERRVLSSFSGGAKDAVFHGIWTAKEAVGKVLGRGLSVLPQVEPVHWHAPPAKGLPPLASYGRGGLPCLTFSPWRGLVASVAADGPVEGLLVHVGGSATSLDLPGSGGSPFRA